MAGGGLDLGERSRGVGRARTIAVVIIGVVSVFAAGGGAWGDDRQSELAGAAALVSADRGSWWAIAAPAYPASAVCDPTTGGLAHGFGTHRPNEIDVIGRTRAGRPILAEHYGPRIGPQIMIVGAIHGNECASAIWTSAARQASWEHVGVWIIPALNPDGYAAFSRRNLAGVDLNADGTNRREPETQALLEMTERVQPLVTVHIHSPNGFIGWHGTNLAIELSNVTGAATGIRVSTAGSRAPGRWFLWQAQRSVAPTTGAVLFEIAPVIRGEAASATRRLPTSSTSVERDRARRVWDAWDAHFAVTTTR